MDLGWACDLFLGPHLHNYNKIEKNHSACRHLTLRYQLPIGTGWLMYSVEG